MFKKILCILIVLSLFSYCQLFKERPVISSLENTSITTIIYISENGDMLTFLENYNEAEILSYLHLCKEKFTLSRVNEGYPLSDYTLMISLNDSNAKEFKTVLLGENAGYSYSNFGGFKYNILESDKHTKKILELLCLE